MRERLLTARGVHGFWPATSDGEDIAVAADRGELRFCDAAAAERLRRRRARTARSRTTSRLPATTSARSPSAIFGADELAARFEAEHDDYRAILAKALADRFAEAFAEFLHEESRRAWYEQGERRSNEELIAEGYRGIRPAFGYPACPDHSEKGKLFELLGARGARARADRDVRGHARRGASAGSTSHHPEARYFSVGRVGRDQVESYAARKGLALAEAERWLRPNLAYEPDERALEPA